MSEEKIDKAPPDSLDRPVDPPATHSNGLRLLGGTWSEEEFRDFVKATAQFEAADEST